MTPPRAYVAVTEGFVDPVRLGELSSSSASAPLRLHHSGPNPNSPHRDDSCRSPFRSCPEEPGSHQLARPAYPLRWLMGSRGVFRQVEVSPAASRRTPRSCPGSASRVGRTPPGLRPWQRPPVKSDHPPRPRLGKLFAEVLSRYRPFCRLRALEQTSLSPRLSVLKQTKSGVTGRYIVLYSIE